MSRSSKNHHYIPQFILRRFCCSGSSIYYYSKKRSERGVEKRNTLSVFKTRHLNSYLGIDGQRTDELEINFNDQIDAPMSTLLNEIECKVQRIDQIELSFLQKRDIYQFIYNHMKRTPEFHQKIIDETLAEITFPDVEKEVYASRQEGRAAAIEWYERYTSEAHMQSKARTMMLAEQSERTLNILAQKKIVFGIPNMPTKQFIVSSNPVIRLYNKRNATLDSDALELWTTLSPRIALGLVSQKVWKETLLLIPSAEVRKLNVGLVEQSNAFAAKNQTLMDSLVSSNQVSVRS